MHSNSEVMNTPINSYVIILWAVWVIPVLATSSLSKGEMHKATQIKSASETSLWTCEITEWFVADYIQCDFSACKTCYFNIDSVYLVSTELKNIKL